MQDKSPILPIHNKRQAKREQDAQTAWQDRNPRRDTKFTEK